MKIVNVTSKTTMNVPARFTMKELYEANVDAFPNIPYEKAYPTLNARVDRMVKKGELEEIASVKRQAGRGRVAIVYALPDASMNPKDKNDPLYIAKKQGRYVPVVKVTSTETDTTLVPDGSPVEAVSVETVDVPVEVVADPVATVEATEPSGTEHSVETVAAV